MGRSRWWTPSVLAVVGMAVGASGWATPVSAQWDPAAANRPVEPFRIAGNIHYVGAVDIAAYLITTPEGHILLDGGLPETAPLIESGIRALGFRVEDVRVLLNSHAHFDHAGGLAALKAASGARLLVSEADAELVERGGLGDDLMGDDAPFPAVAVDQRFADGHVVRLGGTELTAHVTAGHTRGCTTWTMTVQEEGRTLDVVFVCSVTVLPGARLVDRPTYPGIADDYARSFERLESLPVDVFLASHGSFFGLDAKAGVLAAGAPSNPFVDPERYRRYVERGKRIWMERLASERGGEGGGGPPPGEGRGRLAAAPRLTREVPAVLMRPDPPHPEAPVRPSVLSVVSIAAVFAVTACASEPDVDVVVRGGTIYDGSGSAGYVGDVAIRGDSIVAVGDIGSLTGATEIDATGMAVSPGFVNMLSWATESLLEDGTGQSDLRQGVTLEIFGEGESMGPLNDAMKADMVRFQGDLKFDVTWTTLGEYLETLERKGVAMNVASFVGATTVRVHELGYDDRPPAPDEMARMQELVRAAMREGALGVGSSLIYAPAFYADTPELIALMEAAAESGGSYISHMRSEGNRLLESVDELIEIARASGAPAEIYHLKAAGEANWHKMDSLIARVEAARSEGLQITADMYTYTAGATGLDAAMPPWVQEGGYDAWAERMKDPAVRARVIREMRTPTDAWENLLLAAGSPERVLLVGFKADSLKHLTGKTLAEAAALYGTSPENVAVDLVIKDGSRVGTVYFMMSEENLRKQIALPWVSFDSDAGALAIREPYTLSNPHPRAYGNFARVLGKYVREEGVLTLEEAVRKLSALPAQNLKLARRGMLRPGYFADVVVFDPATVTDHATFENPHQYATGVRHVFVNGGHALADGEPTGVMAGRVVRGPGWTGGG